jgi:hypothetical protein
MHISTKKWGRRGEQRYTSRAGWQRQYTASYPEENDNCGYRKGDNVRDRTSIH